MSRRRAARALLFLLPLALLPPACGRKTDPRPPELVRPEIVGVVEVRNVADGIEVSWKRPRDYVDGSRMYDLGGFRVERGKESGPWILLAEITVADNDRFRPIKSFKHTDPGTAPGESYRYRVQSFTTDGHVSEPAVSEWVVREVPPVATPAVERKD